MKDMSLLNQTGKNSGKILFPLELHNDYVMFSRLRKIGILGLEKPWRIVLIDFRKKTGKLYIPARAPIPK